MTAIASAMAEGNKPEHCGAGFDLRITFQGGRVVEGPVQRATYGWAIEVRGTENEFNVMDMLYINEALVETAEVIW